MDDPTHGSMKTNHEVILIVYRNWLADHLATVRLLALLTFSKFRGCECMEGQEGNQDNFMFPYLTIHSLSLCNIFFREFQSSVRLRKILVSSITGRLEKRTGAKKARWEIVRT